MSGISEFIKNVEPDNDVVGKWEKVGLLLQLDDEKKLKCALLYEEAMELLLAKEELKDENIHESHEIIIFPLIYRVVNGVDVSTELDFNEINQILVDRFPVLKSLEVELFMTEIDWEAEFTADTANIIIEKYKKQ